LWDKVAATIRPLSRRPIADSSAIAIATPPESKSKGRLVAIRPTNALPPPRTPHGAATLDGSWDRKLSRGTISPDRVIDLHGHSLDRAWDSIDLGLERAISAGERVVLLVTGHAPRGEPPVERGKIRAAVHDWLAASRHAGRIAAVRSAHPRHGGGGSLYVVLRRG
jgi:DNA-nicking Smr family endonuclease